MVQTPMTAIDIDRAKARNKKVDDRYNLRLEPLPLTGSEEVLLKFLVTRFSLVPSGIERLKRQDDTKMDVKHQVGAFNAGERELTSVGRHREGRVDTGEPVIRNIPDVQVAVVRRGLAAKGYRLIDMHYFSKKRVNEVTDYEYDQYSIILHFSRKPDALGLILTDEQRGALNDLATRIWKYGHVWNNSRVGTPATINLIGGEQKRVPKYALRVRNNAVIGEPVQAEVTEAEE